MNTYKVIARTYQKTTIISYVKAWTVDEVQQFVETKIPRPLLRLTILRIK